VLPVSAPAGDAEVGSEIEAGDTDVAVAVAVAVVAEIDAADVGVAMVRAQRQQMAASLGSLS
jgi:hypothetical protein